ncbi:MAG: hypothetical protein PHQ05_11810 [Sterolibacterium sp.]|nr:hypothetical protein [Sterolibacterium sp.]
MSKKEKFSGQEQTHTESHNADLHAFENHTLDTLQTAGHDAKSGSSADFQEGYKFVVADGVVTSVTEVEHGLTKAKSIKPSETFTLSGNDVLKTESKGAFQEITRYTDANNDGLYQKVSETKVLSADAASTIAQAQHDPAHSDHMNLDFDAAGQTVSTAHLSNDGVVDTPDANIQSGIRNGLEAEAIKGPAIHWESRDGNGDAIHAEVAHGTDPIATLTGLATDPATVDYWF